VPTARSTAEVVWNGDLFEGSGRFSVESRALPETPVSWAARTDRPTGKTSPEELIAAAHASCYAMAFSNALAEAGHAPDQLRIRATCTFDFGAGRITSVELDAEGRVPGVDAGEFERLAQKGEEGCPVSNALRGSVEIKLSARLAE
jgi:lipoyl-dependent peroxiredoxin